MISEELLKATEARYGQRQQARSAIAAQLACGGVAQANAPEQVRRRLERVGAPSPAESARAILAAQEGTGPGDPTLERILGNNDLLGVAYLDIAARVARSVGCVRMRHHGRALGSGTGFLIAPHLLLTNHHVLACAEMASESFVEFDYQDDADGVRRHSILFDLEPQTFFLTEQALDYTVTAVKPTARDGQTAYSLRYGPMT